MDQVRREKRFRAGIGAGLVRMTNDCRENIERPANLLNLHPASFNVLSIYTIHGQRRVFETVVQNGCAAAIVRRELPPRFPQAVNRFRPHLLISRQNTRRPTAVFMQRRLI
jgi:hypothetical protein